MVARGKKHCSLSLTKAKSYEGEVNVVDDMFTRLWYMQLGNMSLGLRHDRRDSHAGQHEAIF